MGLWGLRALRPVALVCGVLCAILPTPGGASLKEQMGLQKCFRISMFHEDFQNWVPPAHY